MPKKLDAVGILIYTGMAGSVVIMVLILVFTVFKDLITGA